VPVADDQHHVRPAGSRSSPISTDACNFQHPPGAEVPLLHRIRRSRLALGHAPDLPRSSTFVLTVAEPSHACPASCCIPFGWRRTEGKRRRLALLLSEKLEEMVHVVLLSVGPRCRTTARVQPGRVPAHSTPEPFRSVWKDDLVEMQRDPGIRRKCKPAAQP
jgi:hypothetical protein